MRLDLDMTWFLSNFFFGNGTKNKQHSVSNINQVFILRERRMTAISKNIFKKLTHQEICPHD